MQTVGTPRNTNSNQTSILPSRSLQFIVSLMNTHGELVYRQEIDIQGSSWYFKRLLSNTDVALKYGSRALQEKRKESDQFYRFSVIKDLINP